MTTPQAWGTGEFTATDLAIDQFSKKIGNMMARLWERWQDEKEHEDINEYKIPLDQLIDPGTGIVITSMTKKPFGCRVLVNTKAYHITMKAKGRGLAMYVERS